MISLSMYFMLVTMTTLSKNTIFLHFPKNEKLQNLVFFRIAKYFCGIDLKLSRKLLEDNIDIV